MAQSTDHLPDLRRHTALPRKLPSTDESSPLLLHSDRARMHLSNGCSYLPPDRIDQRHTLNNLLLQAPPLSTPRVGHPAWLPEAAWHYGVAAEMGLLAG